MALHNTDKNSQDRGNPHPLTHDLSSLTGVPIINAPRPAHSTLSTAYAQPGMVPSGQASLGQFIQTGVINCVYTGGLEQVFSAPHGLGYAPFALGALNNATVTGISDGGTTSVPLPTWLTSEISSSTFVFVRYITMMADNNNVYCYMVNADGGTGSFAVTYYLYKQPAVQ